jgi:glycosidase
MAAQAPSESWLKKAVIYNILIDRFARGHNEPWLCEGPRTLDFCGGNLQGVIDKLDYLQELGINTILLTPFHPTPVYHGYHVLDFYGVDPRFGTLETVKTLLAEAHKRGMRVIMDFVLNHVSHQHPYFIDAKTNPKSKYRSWFEFTRWPDRYVSFLHYYEVPKLVLRNPEVRDHVIGAALKWVDLGFDGLRLDHALGVPHAFIKELHAVMKRHNPECMLIGESVIGRIHLSELKTLRMRNKFLMYIFSQLRINTNFFLQLQYRHELDGVFDFFFRDMAEKFIVHGAWYKPRWLLNLILKVHYAFYPKSFSPIPLLDNIDLDRFSYQLKDNKEKLQEAIKFQFAQKQPIMLLYGNEAGIKQRKGRSGIELEDSHHGDVEIRGTMPWNTLDKDLFSFYQELIKQHKKGAIL